MHISRVELSRRDVDAGEVVRLICISMSSVSDAASNDVFVCQSSRLSPLPVYSKYAQ